MNLDEEKRNNNRRRRAKTTLQHFQDASVSLKRETGKTKPKSIVTELKEKAENLPQNVAIIGGGISGLACSRALNSLGIESVVFDTGKHEVGGRCSTRIFTDMDPQLTFDHSAQFITVSDMQNPWGRMVSEMLEAGVVKQWGAGTVGQLEAGQFQPCDALQFYIGVEGMRSVAQHLSHNLQIRRPIWVSKIQRDKESRGWNLWHYNDFLGCFDYIVIAHNGKCAARLMSTAGKKYSRLQQILEVKFGAVVKSPTPKYMQLCSLWVLLAYFETQFATPDIMEGAFIKGVEELSWAANNCAKLSLTNVMGSCWTIISSAQFGQENKCPQENIPPEHAEMVTDKMLRAFERALSLTPGSLIPSFASVQLWGAANPISVADINPDEPFIFDHQAQVGICGDWLNNASLEAAALSGWKLGNHISRAMHFENEVGSQSVSLECAFKRSQIDTAIVCQV